MSSLPYRFFAGTGRRLPEPPSRDDARPARRPLSPADALPDSPHPPRRASAERKDAGKLTVVTRPTPRRALAEEGLSEGVSRVPPRRTRTKEETGPSARRATPCRPNGEKDFHGRESAGRAAPVPHGRLFNATLRRTSPDAPAAPAVPALRPCENRRRSRPETGAEISCPGSRPAFARRAGRGGLSASPFL